MAGIVPGARPHDLVHAHALHAVMNSESLHVGGHLIGQRRASSTNGRVYLDSVTLSEAVERMGMVIE